MQSSMSKLLYVLVYLLLFLVSLCVCVCEDKSISLDPQVCTLEHHCVISICGCVDICMSVFTLLFYTMHAYMCEPSKYIQALHVCMQFCTTFGPAFCLMPVCVSAFVCVLVCVSVCLW